jgi:hypothetical protein
MRASAIPVRVGRVTWLEAAAALACVEILVTGKHAQANQLASELVAQHDTRDGVWILVEVDPDDGETDLSADAGRREIFGFLLRLCLSGLSRIEQGRLSP